MSYTQFDLANILHVKPNTISNYENSVSEPTINQLSELIKIFDITADDLLFKDLESIPDKAIESISSTNDTTCALCAERVKVISTLEKYNSLLEETVTDQKARIAALESGSKGESYPTKQTA